MSWYNKIIDKTSSLFKSEKKLIPDGVWAKCDKCQTDLFTKVLLKNYNVCPNCEAHLAVTARQRIEWFLDENSEVELGKDLESKDILKFKALKSYRSSIKQAQQKTGEKEALIAFKGKLFNNPIAVCAFEIGYIGGSMGSVVGEKFILAAQQALEDNSALVCFSASGGARMQESLMSLMQMARTSAILAKLRTKGIPFISVCVNPTYGGVSASLAMLGDLNIAEPKAMIGFAGPRVIEQTVREALPTGFQTAEFLLEHGAIDKIIDRRDMRRTIASIIAMLKDYPPLPEEDPWIKLPIVEQIQ